MIKLWYSQGACSLAARILLNEVEAQFEGVDTPVREGATLAPAFARINPKRRVPVLSIDDAIITELPAIMIAIASIAPQRRLMGVSASDIVRTYEWLNWLSGTLHAQGFGCLWRPERFSNDLSSHAEIKKKGLETIAEGFDLIESRLSGPYAVSDHFSSVDAFLVVFYRWGNMIDFKMSVYERFTQLIFGLLERPSIAKAFLDERITIEGLQ